MSEKDNAALAALTEQVDLLRDLFERRLLHDRKQQQLYDRLYTQLDFANHSLGDQFVTPLLMEMFLVVDRIECHSARGDSFAESVREELLEVAARRGVRQHVPVPGEVFDPALHEAVEQVVLDDAQAGKVAAVRRAGYRRNGQSVRPAQVIVGVSAADNSDC